MLRTRLGLYSYINIFFLFGFITGSLYLFTHPLEQVNSSRYHFSLPSYLAGVFLAAATSYLVYSFGKSTPVVRISEKGLNVYTLFGHRSIKEETITTIRLFDMATAFGASMPAIIVEVTEGRPLYIFSICYANTKAIRKTLAKNFPGKIVQPTLVPAISNTTPTPDFPFEKYAGNPHTSFNGVLSYFWIFLFLTLLQNAYNFYDYLTFLPVFMAVFLLPASQLYYFELSEKELIVKSHVFFWVKKIYLLGNIIQVNVESPHKRSTALRIVQADYSTRLYCAGSLRNNDWKAFLREIRSRRIPVSNFSDYHSIDVSDNN